MKMNQGKKLSIEEGSGLIRFTAGVIDAAAEYEGFRPIKTNVDFIDLVLEGGLEEGNFYLFLGPAKSGKSTFLRSASFAIAQTSPVVYCNFEQTSRNFIATMHRMYTGVNLRDTALEDIVKVWKSCIQLPGLEQSPFIARWPDELEERSFNNGVKPLLAASILEIARIKGKKPVVILENLTDIYNERGSTHDNIVNIVTQTALDIKQFCIKHEIALLLSHHSGKLHSDRPTLDDARDSKRVVDLAHSIFCLFSKDTLNDDGDLIDRDHRIAYLAGRGQDGYSQMRVKVGLKAELLCETCT